MSRFDTGPLKKQLADAIEQPRHVPVEAHVKMPIGILFDMRVLNERTDQALEHHIKSIDNALSAADPEARFELAKNIVGLWFQGTDEQVHEVLGDVVKLRPGRKGYFTLTADGQQLRVWYGLPASFQAHQVDSCGHGLLLSVQGHPDAVNKYLEAFLEITRRVEFTAADGTRLFIGFKH